MADQANKKILIHVCCAACASYVILELEKNNFQQTIFFYNPNFNNFDYHFRLVGIKDLCHLKNVELIVPLYDELEYKNLIMPYQDNNSIKHINDRGRFDRKAREIMISLILGRTVQEAKKIGAYHVTTAMLCSPYRDHSTIWDNGSKIAAQKKLGFYYKDFRKGYWMGRNFARKYDLTIPSYCSDYME